MSPRWGGRGAGDREHEAFLLHPARDEARRCVVTVGRRGIVLRPVQPAGRPVRLPWWAIEGFDGDRTAPGADGVVRQVLRVVTDAGTLSLLLPAPELSVLLARIGRSSDRWRRARHPAVAAATRLGVLATAIVFMPVLSVAVNALGGVGLGVAGRTGPLLRSGARTAARWPVATGATGVAAAVVAVALAITGAQTVPALPTAHAASAQGFDASGMAKLALLGNRGTLHLAAATAPPPPAPAAVADLPPLRPHEVFGFAPYWTLDQSTGFDVQGLTTVAYFSLDVNANGTLDQSGPGWTGYESQALANLVSRAHAAGDRVVLTVTDFDQQSLDALTSSPAAAGTLAAAVVAAVEAKNLDGVNLDFEGQGSGDQAGLTALVGTVSAAVHAANPHYQVTMDTYASAAGDPAGFYDIPALAPEVDGFFVMAYDLNLQGAPSAASPLTSDQFSDETALAQYTAVVPPAKVVLGLPFYGYDWPTTNGTMSASATGTPAPLAASQVLGGGHQLYWDPVTETAWTAYQAGNQWHEQFVEDPTSIYLATQLAASYGVDGVGAWALGMDGNNPAMMSALDGVQPAGDTVPGPLGTPGAPAPAGAQAGAAAGGSGATGNGTTGSSTSTTSTTAPSSTTTTTTAPPTTTTTTTTPSTTTTTTPSTTTTTTVPARSTGTWQGQTVDLTSTTGPGPTGTRTSLGTLTGFRSTDPALACLSSAAGLPVWRYASAPTVDVVTASPPADCTTARFTFPVTGP